MFLIFRCHVIKASSIHRIVIRPSRDKNLFRRHTSRGPLFDAFYQGNLIVRNSTEPGLDSARVLKGMGLTGLLEVWDEVLPYWRFRLEIDKSAELTIQEGEGRPIYRKFKSFAGRSAVEDVLGKTSKSLAPIAKTPSLVARANLAGPVDVYSPLAGPEKNIAAAKCEDAVKSIHPNSADRHKKTK
jgi:hypothetical protein